MTTILMIAKWKSYFQVERLYRQSCFSSNKAIRDKQARWKMRMKQMINKYCSTMIRLLKLFLHIGSFMRLLGRYKAKV